MKRWHLVLVLGLALGWTGLVQGQPVISPSAPAKKIIPAEAPILDESHAREAHRLVERWIVQGAVPAPEQVQPIWVTDLTGVRITLRWLGKRLAMADAYAPPAPAPEKTAPAGETVRSPRPVIDLMALMRQAGEQAIKQVEQAMKEAADRSVPEAGPAAATRPQLPMTLARIGPQILVDLQLARSLEPIVLAADAPRDALLHQFAPGYHGLKLTLANANGIESAAFIWPATALASNTSPASHITQLQAQLQLPLNQVNRIARPALARANQPVPLLYRFPMIHLVRYEPDQPVVQLVRGQTPLSTAPIDTPALNQLADRLASRMLAIIRENGQMPGTYHPASDRFEPFQATPSETALAAYALARQVRWIERGNPNHSRLAEMKAGLRRLTEILAKQQVGTPTPLADPAATALIVMALLQAPNPGDLRPARDLLIKRLAAFRLPDGAFASQPVPPGVSPGIPPRSSPGNSPAATSQPVATQPSPATVNLPTQALLTAASVEVFDLTRDPADRAAAQKALNYLWEKTPVNQLPGVMPWLAYAHLRMERLSPPLTPAAQAASKARMEILLTLGKALRAKQITVAPPIGPSDVVGGIDLGQSAINAPPAPDWRTAQFLCFLAQMLPEPPIKQGPDRNRWILDAGLAARFIAQMTCDESAAYFVPFKRDMVGGVRLAPYDNRVGVVSSAMALLAVGELQQALGELSRP